MSALANMNTRVKVSCLFLIIICIYQIVVHPFGATIFARKVPIKSSVYTISIYERPYVLDLDSFFGLGEYEYIFVIKKDGKIISEDYYYSDSFRADASQISIEKLNDYKIILYFRVNTSILISIYEYYCTWTYTNMNPRANQ